MAERRTAIDVPLEVIHKIEQEKEEIIRIKAGPETYATCGVLVKFDSGALL